MIPSIHSSKKKKSGRFIKKLNDDEVEKINKNFGRGKLQTIFM